MMAEAVAKVRFPIVPVIHQDEEGNLKLIRGNSKLLTPRDFDHSPYFDVIKYPIIDFDELGIYRKLPWDRTSVHCNDIGDCFYSHPDEIENLVPIFSSNTVEFKQSGNNNDVDEKNAATKEQDGTSEKVLKSR